MQKLARIEPVDYLVIGHLTQDLTPAGPTFGGTVTYAALTARALGLRVGIVTSFPPELPLPNWEGIEIAAYPSGQATTFENIYTPEGRVQVLHGRADDLDLSNIPETWRSAPLIHLGPVAREVDPKLARQFPNAFVGLTPQGWLRDWNRDGNVFYGDWLEAGYVLEQASAAVLSIEDVRGDERVIEDMSARIRILVVTEGSAGARVYWNGDVRHFPAPKELETDATGAGDIFAATFFHRLQTTRDPWEACRCANSLAAVSVTRPGIQGIPTPTEVQSCLIEVIEES